MLQAHSQRVGPTRRAAGATLWGEEWSRPLSQGWRESCRVTSEESPSGTEEPRTEPRMDASRQRRGQGQSPGEGPACPEDQREGPRAERRVASTLSEGRLIDFHPNGLALG